MNTMEQQLRYQTARANLYAKRCAELERGLSTLLGDARAIRRSEENILEHDWSKVLEVIETTKGEQT